MRKRLTVLTVGCKSSFADSATLLRQASESGFEVVPDDQPADVVFISGCTVTHRADRDNRALARRARRKNPHAVLVMTGCFPATASSETREGLPEIDHWLPTGGDGALPLLRLLSSGFEPGEAISDYRADRILGHKRTFLKIQDGCDSRCAYCVVPLARGGHRSFPADEIVDGAIASEKDGATEFLLTGIHIGRYGSDRNEPDGLADLTRRLLEKTFRPRIRLGSIEPLEISPALLSLFQATDRLCPHLHIPLQSGSDRVLERMRRPYSAGQFAEAVARVRETAPLARIGADVMAGFPGETEEDFAETTSLVERAGIDYLHVFPYSARPGTESSRWPDDVSEASKKDRVSQLNRIDVKIRERFLSRQIGRTLTVLVQRTHPDSGMVSGISEYGVDVRLPGEDDSLCRMVPVLIESAAGGWLLGRPGVPIA
ncbi:MAG TPA: MiaB/RimO family radical SAM methylthiotransferase [Candidatus Deferrimicrobiaceae bacterium]|jgi:threonylcarbamoyladenosine tRNA methylthiotransferase MtaB